MNCISDNKHTNANSFEVAILLFDLYINKLYLWIPIFSMILPVVWLLYSFQHKLLVFYE